MTEILHFTKMEALGNDYIYIDRDRYPSLDYPALARRYSDRHTGIGGDGVVTYSRHDAESFEMHIYNKDGSEADRHGGRGAGSGTTGAGQPGATLPDPHLEGVPVDGADHLDICPLGEAPALLQHRPLGLEREISL